MTASLRVVPVVLAAAGLVLFVVASAMGSNPLYGVADILVGAGLALFALQPQPPWVRSPALVHAGLGIAALAAVIDGLLTLGDNVGTATSVLTFVIVGGILLAVLGRGRRTG